MRFFVEQVGVEFSAQIAAQSQLPQIVRLLLQWSDCAPVVTGWLIVDDDAHAFRGGREHSEGGCGPSVKRPKSFADLVTGSFSDLLRGCSDTLCGR